MAISALLVKELRERTAVSMMECKKALEETNGDMDAAIKVLRERGIAKAAKRADRVASEGLVAVAIAKDYTAATVAQLNCETDFVARNEDFSALARESAEAGLKAKATDLDGLLACSLPTGRKIADALEDIVTKIGEKIEFGSYNHLTGDVLAGYIHPPGKIGVLIAAKAEGLDAGKKLQVSEALREVAMHIAAFAPRFLDSSQVDGSTLEQEKEIFAQLARNEGKPENIIPKIVEGRVKSFYKESCLVEQAFAKDNTKTITQVVNDIGKAAGAKITLTGFIRVQIGVKA